MNESSAIRLCLKYRDPVGFEFLVKKYRKEAYFHAVSILGNQEDAADACQESFSRAFTAMPRLSRLNQFYPWFYTILRNCCLNMIRKRQSAVLHIKNRENLLPLSDKNDPSLLFEKSEEQHTVWKTLQTLSPEFREILILKYIQEYQYDEIAGYLNIPRGTVMSRLYYARKAFRESYQPLAKASNT